ncbi:BRO1-domain-containing protein [Cylindrobasidium torrendii FP15055 ss-10]|uniref:BRO1-domain-containing protein n=1 Tax=Cylindrobasidium torrendii FP15055 ss-10 TaxID=1314674 RepID=A0A0D7B6P1_9AGAR|nr:BRO1-domain-containing protein [Cylindrobasidium torrendii FP15055 ss-10]
MSNLISIPFKKSYSIDVKEPARRYLEEHTSFHPDAFKADLNQWQVLRDSTVNVPVHVQSIEKLTRYHAQLVAVLTKLPADIGLDISYAHPFRPEVVPVTLRSLVFERASVVFNLAALYSQLGLAEDRSHVDGIKRAIGAFQNATGTLSYLRTEILPQLVFTGLEEETPHDLSRAFIRCFEWLMLAQAQECFWQKAKLDGYKNALIAKLAANTSATYALALSAIQDAPPEVKHLFPLDQLAHIEAKQYHFQAGAYFRKAQEESDKSNYGWEVAYLQAASAEAKRASDVANSRRGVSTMVKTDVKSLVDHLYTELQRAERDNDLIYHKDVPAPSALPTIAHASIAKQTIPSALTIPVKPKDAMFHDLLSWGAQEAINIYNDRKQNLVKEEIIDVDKSLRSHADSFLRQHNLPASLEALERPVGLPPSLLKKAGEVRRENGPVKIDAWFEDLRKQAAHVNNILDEALDILDDEATEDDLARESGGVQRAPSHEANEALVGKERRYREIIVQARNSDETVRRKWEEWEDSIVDLIIEEKDLENLIPSTTGTKNRTAEAALTQRHARMLRTMLENLDEQHQRRIEVVSRAEALARSDDIRGRIQEAAAKASDSAEIQPSAFENILEDELAKYDRFIELIRQSDQTLQDTLASIEDCNDKFLSSRKEDPSIKERERALQSLDLSYHKYKEIGGNLEEGIKFYNDLAGLLLQYKDSCKLWCNHRHEELLSLSSSFASISLDDQKREDRQYAHEQAVSSRQEPEDDNVDDELEALEAEVRLEEEEPESEPEPEPEPARAPEPRRILSEKAKGKMPALPSLGAADWGFESISLPPPPPHQTPRKTKKRLPA